MQKEWCNMDIFSTFRAAQDRELWTALLLGAALNANGLQPTDYQQSTTSSPVNTYTVNRNEKCRPSLNYFQTIKKYILKEEIQKLCLFIPRPE